ncbi:Bacterial transcription activator, effector binding domain [Aquisphaera giovannonii]|uniref:Bacterial transcription activator, effector binding domain n=1 Tax=Aquisphaera giovannonii TaxID=406548 RepID=A0A5B9VW71_9BACT|nr:GyrI-like domain-containing protein [Aquisphaera giovannonii]QEH32314.1 Bacterial transcription activator, effector binding domain [Aquisphaera giovannonii]
MSRVIQVVDSPARAAAVIRMTVPQREMPSVMKPAIDEILAVLKAQGVKPAGPLFNHYLSMDSGLFDFETGFPIDAPIEPSGRVRPGELPAAKVARTVHFGPYENLHHAWGVFTALVRSEGLTPAGGLWECYQEGPESGPDPSNWRTELNLPIEG